MNWALVLVYVITITGVHLTACLRPSVDLRFLVAVTTVMSWGAWVGGALQGAGWDGAAVYPVLVTLLAPAVISCRPVPTAASEVAVSVSGKAGEGTPMLGVPVVGEVAWGRRVLCAVGVVACAVYVLVGLVATQH